MQNSIETRGNLCTEPGWPVFRPGIISTLDGLWNSFVSDAELFMYPNQMHKPFISICKHFEQNEYFSRFELCSDGIKVGVCIYSAGLNHWVGLNCLGVA